jgi:hypothetical protein
MQPIGIPHHDGVEVAAAQVVKHSAIGGAHSALVCAHVVVDVALSNVPALPGDQALAVVDLAADA